MSKPSYGEMRTRAQRIEDAYIKDRVLAGLAVLKERYGAKWVEKIDCRRLDLSHASRCVLGQVCGDFDQGVLQLNPHAEFDLKWADENGFYDDNGDYEPLDEAWHVVLCDREEVPGGAPCQSS